MIEKMNNYLESKKFEPYKKITRLTLNSIYDGNTIKTIKTTNPSNDSEIMAARFLKYSKYKNNIKEYRKNELLALLVLLDNLNIIDYDIKYENNSSVINIIFKCKYNHTTYSYDTYKFTYRDGSNNADILNDIRNQENKIDLMNITYNKYNPHLGITTNCVIYSHKCERID